MTTRTVDLSARCPRCRMRLDACLCAAIPRIETRTRVVLLTHWRETWATTNTGRLTALALPNSEIRVRGARDERLSWDGVFAPEREALFLFPDEGAEELDAFFAASLAKPATLIVPDGTWRQTRRVGRREPALAPARRVRLPPGQSRYLLRKPRRACLSTMEAVAAALGILESTEAERRLIDLFDLMVSRTLATRSPPAQRARGLPWFRATPYNSSMGLRATLTLAHDALERVGVDHALIGGIGLATLGIHRATEDVDMLIRGDERGRATDALTKAGFVLQKETDEVLHFEGKGRLDLLLANRPPSREMLSGARVFAPHGMKCVSPEGLIGLKIQAYTNDRRRELQDKADIRSLAEKFPGLSQDKVREYADLFGEWEVIRALVGWK